MLYFFSLTTHSIKKRNNIPGDIENSNEGSSLATGTVQGFVNPVDEPFEHSLIAGFADRLNGEDNLLLILSLVHEFSSDLEKI